MIRLFKHYIPYAVLLLGLLDLVLLLVAGEAGWLLRASHAGLSPGLLVDHWLPLIAFALVMWSAMISVGVYGPESLRSIRFAFARLGVALSLGIIALSVIDFLIPGSTFWRSTLLYAVAIAVPLLLINRIIIGKILGAETFRRNIVVLGAGRRAARLQGLAERDEAGFAVSAFVAMSGNEPDIADAISRSDVDDLAQFVADCGASEVILALEERRNALPLKDLLRIKTTGVHVNDFSTFIEQETGRVDLDSVNPSWLIFSDGFASGGTVASVIKRVFDIVVSSILLLLFTPVVALFALLVKLDSKGPAFFRQERVGLFGEKFYVTKLRSMRTDAEKDGVKWAEKDDPRITRLGRFIRKVRIDELPQAWSVLRGDMSFVGPRPEVPKFVTDLEAELPYFAERHMVKPGITGWAQINYPYGASIEDARHKLEYDLYYAKNYSPFLDVLILLQTLRVILWPEGAR